MVMMVEVSDADFDEVVSEALDQVPEGFLELLDNVVILVEDVPDGPDKTFWDCALVRWQGIYEKPHAHESTQLFRGVVIIHDIQDVEFSRLMYSE